MNMFDEARSVQGMLKMRSMTQSDMAKQMGVSQSYVANKLRLLSFGEEEQQKICSEGLSERHARALLKLKSAELRSQALDRICRQGLTVRETEALVDLLHDGTAPERIGSAAKRMEGVECFLDTLKASLQTLSAIGVDASRTVGYYGKKMYITICIEE